MSPLDADVFLSSSLTLIYNKLEIRFRKTLAKLKGSAVRIKSKKPKGKKTMKEKKPESATRGFEPASQLPPAKHVGPLTTGTCGGYNHFH